MKPPFTPRLDIAAMIAAAGIGC